MSIICQEHFGIARKIVSNMTSESWETIPHVCVTYEPEVSGFLDMLREINEGKEKAERISVNTALLKVITEGLKECPKMNSHIHFSRRLVRGRVDTFDHIDISMPVILKSGEMMTLNMHSFESKSMTEMKDAIEESITRANNSDMNQVMYEVSLDNTVHGLMKGRLLQTLMRLIGSKTGKHRVKTLHGARKKEYYKRAPETRLTKHDIEQGTITVSNLGSIYRNWNGACTILEIIPPQVVAIGIGASQKVPVCDQNGKIRTGEKIPFTIAFDHRALDMGDIVPFMKKLDSIFAEPAVLKEWI